MKKMNENNYCSLKTLVLVWTGVSVLLLVGLLTYTRIKLEHMIEEANSLLETKIIELIRPMALFKEYLKQNNIHMEADQLKLNFEIFKNHLEDFRRNSAQAIAQRVPIVEIIKLEGEYHENDEKITEVKGLPHPVQYWSDDDIYNKPESSEIFDSILFIANNK